MERIRQSFDRQGFMRALGATLESVESGVVTISCGFEERLTQQHGLLHGAVLAARMRGTVFDATRTRVLAKMTATMMSVDATSS
jgi:hypothetical protein